MKEVESSTISHIGYTNGTLSVRFKSNPKVVYDYPNVTADEHARLMAAKSIGSHSHNHIKGRDFTKRSEP